MSFGLGDVAVVFMGGGVEATRGGLIMSVFSFTTMGTTVRLAGGTIAYKSQLQPTVAGSSTESEFIQANGTGKICLFVRSIMWDLGIPQHAATLIYEDNDACTAMTNAQKPTPRTRHVEIKYFALSEWVERDLLSPERVDTSINMADNFTKPLNRILFHRHTDVILGHIPPQFPPVYKRIIGTLTSPTNITTPDQPPILTADHPIAAAAAHLCAPWFNLFDHSLHSFRDSLFASPIPISSLT